MKRKLVWCMSLSLFLGTSAFAGPVNSVVAAAKAIGHAVDIAAMRSLLPGELAAKFKGIVRYNRIDIAAGEVYRQLGERAPPSPCGVCPRAESVI